MFNACPYQLILVGGYCNESGLYKREGLVVGRFQRQQRIGGVWGLPYDVNARQVLVHGIQYNLHCIKE